MKFLLPSGGPSFHTQVTGCFSHFMDLQLGLQFDALFENDLYFNICAQANQLADRIRDTLKDLQVPSLAHCTTNQIFPILPDVCLDKLSKEFTFTEMHRVDENHRAIRFCTSWATTEESVEALCGALRQAVLG